jgi:hypothetical protein
VVVDVVAVADKVLVQVVDLVLVAVGLAVVEQELAVVNVVVRQVVLVAVAADQVVEEDNSSFNQLNGRLTFLSLKEYK